MSRSDAPLTVAFVSAPGSSVFMEELLAGVADAVAALDAPGVTVVAHHGLVSEVVDSSTVAVVVPHEYAAVAPHEPDELLARTVALGVEHPGTWTFRASVRASARLGARFEISQRSLDALAERGLDGSLFPLGHVPRWDMWGGRPVDRDIDIAYLGTADPRRLGILAHAAPALTGLRTELLAPPHEPMTGPRPDFLVGADKWRLLARSKVLVNLHREDKAALEWVRVLEAMHNGCVVVTEPSTDLGPLRPGEHLLVAEPHNIGLVAAALARDDALRERMARSAYDLCRELDLAVPAKALVQACRGLASRPAPARPEPVEHPGVGWTDGQAPLAVWLPAANGGPPAPEIAPAPLDRTRSSHSAADGCVVLVAALAGDGPAAATTRSLATHAPGLEVRVATPAPDVRRGPARNALLAGTDAAYVAVLDGGDELLGDTLEQMVALLRADDGLDAVLCPATHGTRSLVNVLVPEERRLREREYLTRGYVVRRATLEALGGFTEDADHADLVDHHFWLSLAAGGGRTSMLRRIGLALWPR
jgi:hypothetical protein